MVAEIRNTIHFLLNHQSVDLSAVSPVQTLLDFLRLDRGLRGTKEGCAEGDCGACTVLVGRLSDGQLKYETVNACIRFVGSLDGCHVVTVESLAAPGGPLHPVQQAMVDTHASQCGFCTPGFVMSLYGLWMENPRPTVEAIEKALQGNLCRCTGYAPIIRAAEAISAIGEVGKDPLVAEREAIGRKLQALKDDKRVVIGEGRERFVLPASVDDLAEIYEAEPDARIVAGATDVGEPMTFYSPDHPMPLTPNEIWSSGLTSLDEAKRYGFIGICEVGAWNQQACDAWMKQNAADGEEMVITTQRFYRGSARAATAWNVFIVLPANRETPE